VVAVGAALVATLPASAARPKHHAHRAPVYAGARYLALGDGPVFGYREPTNLPTPNYAKPRHFKGYPEVLATDLGLKLENAACPGETSGSFINIASPTNGCERGVGNVGPGYRKHGLKILYVASQLFEGISFARSHKSSIRLVTLMIGMEDLRLCEETTTDHCAAPSQRAVVMKRIRQNVGQLLYRLRRGSSYHGQIVVVTYYSTNYNDPVTTSYTEQVNNALVQGAKKHGVRVANGFGIFKRASRQTGGNPCTAGLLTILAGGGCGTSPSVAGQALLASAVERVVRKSNQG
jgi:lysophospholipase L1-like esterase